MSKMLNFAQQLVNANRNNVPNAPWAEAAINAVMNGDFLNRVLIHELGHATMVSYDLLQTIHQMVYPEYWMEMEEWICNFIADYGLQIFRHAYEILGERAWVYVPQELERLVA